MREDQPPPDITDGLSGDTDPDANASESSDGSRDLDDFDESERDSQSSEGDMGDSQSPVVGDVTDMKLVLLRPQSDGSFCLITTSSQSTKHIGHDHILWPEEERDHCSHEHPIGRVFQQIAHMMGLPAMLQRIG